MSDIKRSPERIAACKASSNKLYRERREWGVCVICGKPRRNGETTAACIACIKARAEYREQNRRHIRESTKARMDQRRAEGLCIYCGKPALPERRLCGYHLEHHRETDRKNRIHKREARQIDAQAERPET